MSRRMGKMSIQVTSCSPRQARRGVREAPQYAAPNSLSEPGAVLLFQPQPDLRHRSVHFGVRQGALRASESQGECDALASFVHLRSVVLVKRTNMLEQVAARLLDRRVQLPGGDGVLDHDRKVAL